MKTPTKALAFCALVCGSAIAFNSTDSSFTIASNCFAGEPTDWPEFRGPTAQGLSDQTNLPVRWSESENILWKQDLPGLGWSSPIVVGKRIYVTSAVSKGDPNDRESDNKDVALCLLIVDLESGKLLQQVEIFPQRATDSPDIHQKNSHASPTPLFAGGKLYLHFGHQGTACTDLDGKVLWSTREYQYPPTHGNGGSPLLVDDLLIFNADGAESPFIVALNANDGKEVWRVTRPVQAERSFSFCTPTIIVVDGKKQVITPGSNVVQALDPATGKEIWRVRYDDFSVIPRPIVVAGLVMISSGYMRPTLYAIDPKGTGDITDSHVRWKKSNIAPNTPSMVGAENLLFLVNDSGVATCLNATTGEEVWRKRLGGNYSASPLLADGKVYFQSEQGEAIVCSADEKGEELARNELPGRIFASYAVAGPTLVLRSETSIYRIGKATTR